MAMKQAIVLILLASAATAVQAAENGFYFGVSGGQASYDFEPIGPLAGFGAFPGPPLGPLPPEVVPTFNPFTPVTNPGRLPPTSYVAAGPFISASELFWIPGKDDESTAWSALAGYRFFRYAAVELAYHDFGTLHELSPSRTIGPITTVEVKSDLESKGATLSLLGELPITSYWSVFVRAGGLFADQDVSRRIGNTSFKDSYDSEVFLYGLGTEVTFAKQWTVRLDFQRYDDVGKGHGIGEADIDVLALGVLFRLAAD